MSFTFARYVLLVLCQSLFEQQQNSSNLWCYIMFLFPPSSPKGDMCCCWVVGFLFDRVTLHTNNNCPSVSPLFAYLSPKILMLTYNSILLIKTLRLSKLPCIEIHKDSCIYVSRIFLIHSTVSLGN